MIKGFISKRLPGAKRYFGENWGTPFILAFIALLIVAAVSLDLGLTSLANDVAIWSCCSLVVGFVLQLVCFVKYGERVGES
jgi:hypothetical protein